MSSPETFSYHKALHLTSILSLVIDEDFIKETIDTISLLLPVADMKCAKWFRPLQQSSLLDGKIRSLPTATRDIERYTYWRDRLLIIEEAFDQHEPASIRQWWYDDRRKAQSYTFWVALTVLILTIIFGLIQSVASIVQAWASVKSLHH
jgi:hypothetical protein